MSKLTDEQIAEGLRLAENVLVNHRASLGMCVACGHAWPCSAIQVARVALSADHSRGLRDGLERAAKIVEDYPNIGMNTQLRLLAEAIRAEAEKPEPAERKARVWRDSAGVCHGPATCGCEPPRG